MSSETIEKAFLLIKGSVQSLIMRVLFLFCWHMLSLFPQLSAYVFFDYWPGYADCLRMDYRLISQKLSHRALAVSRWVAATQEEQRLSIQADREQGKPSGRTPPPSHPCQTPIIQSTPANLLLLITWQPVWLVHSRMLPMTFRQNYYLQLFCLRLQTSCSFTLNQGCHLF